MAGKTQPKTLEAYRLHQAGESVRNAAKLTGIQRTTLQRYLKQVETGIIMTDHINALAIQIADDAARSDIECYCTWEVEDAGTWYDTKKMNDAARAIELQPVVGRAVEYLDGRGILMRHPDNPDWVRPTQKESDNG